MNTQLSALTLGHIAVRQHNGLFSLNDLHRASGGEDRHRTNYFLQLDQTKALIAEMETAGIPVVSIQEGRNGGSYACQELVVAYAAWINPSFHLKVLRVFLASAQEVRALHDQVRELLAEKAQRALAANPQLAQVLRYHQIEGLSHLEKARLMGWKTPESWRRALKELAALGLVHYEPNPGRSLAGKVSMKRLLNEGHNQNPSEAMRASRQENSAKARAAARKKAGGAFH